MGTARRNDGSVSQGKAAGTDPCARNGVAARPNETKPDEPNKEEDSLRLCRVTEDELRPLRWTREWQPDDAITELGVGLHDGLFGALGFLCRLAPLHIGCVNLRPPRRKEDWIAIAAGSRLFT